MRYEGCESSSALGGFLGGCGLARLANQAQKD